MSVPVNGSTGGFAAYSNWGDHQQQRHQSQNGQYHHPSLQLENHYNNHGSFVHGGVADGYRGLSSSASGSQLSPDHSAHNVGVGLGHGHDVGIGVGGINQLSSSFNTVGSSGGFDHIGAGGPGQVFPDNDFTFGQGVNDAFNQSLFGNTLDEIGRAHV